MFHLLIGGPFDMVFEHLQNSFNLKDLGSGFIQLHQLCSHVVVGCIFGFMV
jgi:fucose permease